MIRNAFTGEPKPKTLAEQKNDFTAEGAPPAGKVTPPPDVPTTGATTGTEPAQRVQPKTKSKKGR